MKDSKQLQILKDGLVNGSLTCGQCVSGDMTWLLSHEYYISISLCRGCGGIKMSPTNMKSNEAMMLRTTATDPAQGLIDLSNPVIGFGVVHDNTALSVGIVEKGGDEAYLDSAVWGDKCVFKVGTGDAIINNFQNDGNNAGTPPVFFQMDESDTPNHIVKSPTLLAVRLLQGWMLFNASDDNTLVAQFLYLSCTGERNDVGIRLRSLSQVNTVFQPMYSGIENLPTQPPSVLELKAMFGKSIVEREQLLYTLLNHTFGK